MAPWTRPAPLRRRGDVEGALAYAQGPLSALRGASPEHDALLRDVVALIAYQQPEQASCAAPPPATRPCSRPRGLFVVPAAPDGRATQLASPCPVPTAPTTAPQPPTAAPQLQSPLAHFLAPAQREATADVVNAALLQSRAPPGSPEPAAALELILQQLTAVQVRWGAGCTERGLPWRWRMHAAAVGWPAAAN